MLKIIASPKRTTSNKLEIDDGKVDKIDVSSNTIMYAKKSGNLKPKNGLNQEKNYQNVKIYTILVLKRPDQIS